MKTKLVAMAGGLACVFATTAMPIHAERLYTSISGSAVALGDLGAITHSVTIPLKKNGEKYNKEGATIITRQKSVFFPQECLLESGDSGYSFIYEYADSISTQPNGDLVFAELDSDDEKVSKICTSAADLAYFEVTLHSKITGGTGEFEGACGSQTATLTGRVLGDGHISSIEGTTEGVILRSADCN